jgi:hypothetical protein
VNVAGRPISGGGNVLDETDGASGLLGGRYERYGFGPPDRSALAWPDD